METADRKRWKILEEGGEEFILQDFMGRLGEE
jgi:hypothetical protein